ncbi:methyltransferase domain-containing protein [archaeon]|nr:methyltransferase domain-containing protein [archaeon]
MNIFGITEHKHNTKNLYKDFNDVVSEEGKYNYRLFSLRLWDLHECIDNLKLRRNDVVLEFGAWNTYGAIYIANKAKHVYTTDNFKWADRTYAFKFGDMTEKGTCSTDRWISEFEDYDNITAEMAEIENLHYKDNTFDKIYSISVIEHVPNDLNALNEAYRVLKRGGIFTFTFEFHPTEMREFNAETGYYRVYTPDDIINLIDKSNFKLSRKELNLLKLSKNYNLDSEFTSASITLKK